MMWSKPTGFFEAQKIDNGWGNPWPVADKSWRDDPEKKKQFAKQLALHSSPFNAACAVFGADTNSALWASHNWVNDPIVQEFKESGEVQDKILDKDQLCHKLAAIADEKSPQGFYVNETKDRVACLKLYAEIQGFIGKVEGPTFNTFANNNLKVVFVKPSNDDQKSKIINHEPIEQEQETEKLEIKPLKLKLV